MPSSEPTIPPELIRKHWDKNQTWRDKLARRSAHKALDISDEDMEIHSKTGIGAGGLIGVALAAGLPAALLAGWMIWKDHAASTPGPQPAATQPKQDGVINRTGKPIDVELSWKIVEGKKSDFYRWRFAPDGAWSDVKPYDPAKGIEVP